MAVKCGLLLQRKQLNYIEINNTNQEINQSYVCFEVCGHFIKILKMFVLRRCV